MNMKKKSILRTLRFYMVSFGILMGFVFPVYASFFVIWKKGAFVYFFAGCILAGITVGAVSYFFVKVILIRPLNKISDQATDIKNRNISEQINIVSNDSIGDIIGGLNSAVLSIRALFSDIHNIYVLADIALNRVEYTEGSTVSVGTIQSAIHHVTEISNTIITLSGKIIEAINKDKQMMNASSAQCTTTLKELDTFNHTMGSLIGRSDKISEITKMIEGISSKTNLLSLNASIEASHAGENGRSFAVVAEEIRKLAATTHESARQISENIGHIQNGIDDARQSVGLLTEGVNNSYRSIYELLNHFDLIMAAGSDNVKENKNLAASISRLNRSFTEIQMVFDELSGNINTLKKISESYNF